MFIIFFFSINYKPPLLIPPFFRVCFLTFRFSHFVVTFVTFVTSRSSRHFRHFRQIWSSRTSLPVLPSAECSPDSIRQFCAVDQPLSTPIHKLFTDCGYGSPLTMPDSELIAGSYLVASASACETCEPTHYS